MKSKAEILKTAADRLVKLATENERLQSELNEIRERLDNFEHDVQINKLADELIGKGYVSAYDRQDVIEQLNEGNEDINVLKKAYELHSENDFNLGIGKLSGDKSFEKSPKQEFYEGLGRI